MNDKFTEKDIEYTHVMDRLKLFLDEKSHAKAAERIGIKANTLKTWNRRGKVSVSAILEHTRDLDISTDWLLYGIGNPRRDKAQMMLADISKMSAVLNNDIDPDALRRVMSSTKLIRLVELLRYAPDDYVTQVTHRLLEFKRLATV